MAGIRLMGNVAASTNNGFTSAPSGGSASQQAFGPSYSTSNGQSGGLLSFLIPNDVGGFIFWGGVVSTVALLVLRHSLPS